MLASSFYLDLPVIFCVFCTVYVVCCEVKRVKCIFNLWVCRDTCLQLIAILQLLFLVYHLKYVYCHDELSFYENKEFQSINQLALDRYRPREH